MEVQIINGERVAVIRTSDRIAFKQCRRKWGWSSHLKGNLEPKQRANPLWLGSGIHYALEDYHGRNLYGSASNALQAYAQAYQKFEPHAMPDDWMMLLEQGIGMMDYYPLWLEGRNPLPTFVDEGVPQLEVSIKVDLPKQLLKNWETIPYDKVVYSLTLDRVIEDENGLLWIVEYKTAKAIQTMHYMTDPQVGAYIWAAEHVYKKPVGGVIYMQFRKDLPKGPRQLKNGHISVAQNQRTTHRLYRQALVDVYGTIMKAPMENITYLNELAAGEDENQDAFIRRDVIHRNTNSSVSEARKILLEVGDMLDPNLSMYPNPTRDCSFMCPFLSACVGMDDGSDYEGELALSMVNRPAEYDGWRIHLPAPETFKLIIEE